MPLLLVGGLVLASGCPERTAACLRSGIPQQVTPHMKDQHYFGRQVGKLKIGPAPVRFSKLNRRRLIEAVASLLEVKQWTEGDEDAERYAGSVIASEIPGAEVAKIYAKAKRRQGDESEKFSFVCDGESIMIVRDGKRNVGSLSELRSSGGDYTLATGTRFAEGVSGTSLPFAGPPPAGPCSP